jgi:hypothetical protein
MSPGRVVALLVVLLLGAGVAVALVPRDDDGGEPAATAAPRAQAPPPSAPAPEAGLGDHLAALQHIASANGGTRAAGTRGDTQTIEYIADRLRATGLRVSTQRVRFPFYEERAAPRVTRLGGGARRLRVPRDVRTMRYSSPGDVTAAVRAIAVRPGAASSSGCEPGDLNALRRGEIALLQRGTCTLRQKALNAQRAGAVAVLILNDGRPGRTGTFGGSLQRPGVRVPVLALSSAVGAELARAARPRLRVVVRTVSATRSTSNVIAEAGARDPRRIVMAGAHLDSVDEGPGLNDNGSGVSAVLEIAEDLAARAVQLPAGTQLRFGFWGAEELGLYGSRRYVGRLDGGERGAHAAYVNLDMVGTPGGTRGVYEGRGDAGRRIERLLRRALGGRIRSEQLGGASDHAPFARAGIPVGGLFTGTGRCYHRRCDTAENVDRELLREMTRAARVALQALTPP